MLGIRYKVRGGFFAGFAALIAVSLLANWSVQRWRNDVDWVVHTKDVLAALGRLFSGIERAETGVRGFTITGDETYLVDYRAGTTSLESELAGVRRLTTDNAIQEQRLNEFEQVAMAKLKTMADITGARQRKGFEAAAAILKTGAGKRQTDQLRSIVSEMRQTEETLLSERLARQSQAASVAGTSLIAGALAALVLGLLAWRSVEHSIAADEAAHARTLDAAQTKSAFLANVSHELRTPLHTIIGYTELLGEEIEGPLNAKQKHYASLILRDGLHLLDLVNEVLDLSKIEAGHLTLNLEHFDVPAAIDEILASIRPRCIAKTIALNAQVAPAILTADRVRFKQIMLNLLSNAVKFTPSGGAIDVHARKHNEFLEISVQDTGPGIAKEDQRWVFDPFYQTQLAAKGSTEGTGLGLAITQRLVEQHGGEIRLESESGKGCSFTVLFPLQLPDAH